MSTVYEEESATLAERKARADAGFSNFDYIDIAKPAGVGQSATTDFRVIPRIVNGAMDPRFWVRVWRHQYKVDGQDKYTVCPDNHDDHGHDVTCPICALRKELFSTKDAPLIEIAKTLGAKGRCFCNVIELANPGGHWTADASVEAEGDAL